MTRSKQIRTARRKQSPDRATLILTIVFAVLAVAVAVTAFVVVRNLISAWTITGLPGAPDPGAGGVLGGPTPSGTEYVQPLQPISGPTAQPWDGKTRITLLFMGLDARDWEAGEIPRSDTMILFTMDPASMTAGMLSIPRDMWVNIPGFEYAKINTAYYLGEAYKLPGGGPGLATQTVEQFLGVPINYYAQVDFNAFVAIIDEMGGLDMHIKEEIKIDPIGKDNTKTLYPGVQTLTGAETLAYARARYTEGDDFSRSERQQQVILAIRDQVLTFNMLPTLLAKAPSLYNELQSGINTNMNLQEIISLAALALEVKDQDIKRAVIGPNEVIPGQSPDGLAILIPIHDKIRLVRDEVFLAGGPVGPRAVATEGISLLQQEQARVAVHNGTQVADLASRTAEYLRGQGINIVEETNADQIYESTTIFIYNGTPYTAKYIAELMNISTSHVFTSYSPDVYADILVILGNDWAQNNTLP
ncbi:MAG: LCP family protein [Anaerolineae bacterium]|nr:LCP family protein [Anaerolineae bacterium]